ncbi:MAG TPA: Gfo/Idh/MocA family oxidoreductase [Bryobacteraceae bacterium]|nr:Gfo/Idh/MocA family oxidoreductase [Bryobacteraceae bacterium]
MPLNRVRVAVVGAGQFGRQHMRVIRQSPQAELAGVLDTDAARAAAAAAEFGCPALADLEAVARRADAAVVATPTVTHAAVGCALLEAGLDVLVEKPIAATMEDAGRLIETAARCGRILQVGHLERFNPAVTALEAALTTPLFFEIHRLSPFSPRSLDVDVILDLMIHDLDIVLSLTGAQPQEIRAAGISILTPKVDIASVRLAFPSGAVANLTASRVSTERVRKLRLFQPHEYVSVDYGRQEAFVLSVTPDGRIASRNLEVARSEPLRLELESFFECVRTRRAPRVDGTAACRALEVALNILDKIEEHAQLVATTLAAARRG